MESSRTQAQRILDEKGFLIVCVNAEDPEPPGIIQSTNGNNVDGERLSGPMAVIGRATREEWEAQQLRYLGLGHLCREFDLRFYKVVSE